jgi:hypothetical protein
LEIIADNLNTHLSESVVGLVAEHRVVNNELGVKEKFAFCTQLKYVKTSLVIPHIGLRSRSSFAMFHGLIKLKSGS